MKYPIIKRVICSILSLTVLFSIIPISSSAYAYGTFFGTTIIPDNVTTLGNSTDYIYFSGFNKAYFPKSIKTIYGDFFYYNNSYEQEEDYYYYPVDVVYYEGTREEWNAIDFQQTSSYQIFKKVIYECKIYDNYIYRIENNQITLLAYVGFETNLTIPSHIDGLLVTTITDTFQNNYHITTVTLPETVKYLMGNAFNNCKNLRRINYNGTLNYVNQGSLLNTPYYNNSELWVDNALYFGKFLVRYNGTKAKFNVVNGTVGISPYAFYNCTTLIDIRLASSVKFIEDSAFSGCSNLRSIYIPKSIKKIGSYVFNNTKNLQYILYGGSAQDLQSVDVDFYNNNILSTGSMRYNYTALENSLDYVTTNNRINVINYFGKDQNVVIPSRVSSIDSNAFNGCKSIMTLTLYDSIQSVSKTAFTNCTGIHTVYFYGTSEKWESLGIEIPTNYRLVYNPRTVMENIGYVFDNDSNSIRITSYTGTKEHLVIPQSYMGCPVSAIDENAFAGNTSLKSLTICGTNLEIGDNAFEGCTALEKVIITDGVSCIWAEAFINCNNLKTVVLPDSLSFIAYKAFYGCNKIENVVFCGSESRWNIFSEEIDRGNEKIKNSPLKFATVIDGIILIADSSHDPGSLIAEADSYEFTIYGCDTEKSTCIDINDLLEDSVTALIPTYDKNNVPVRIYKLENGNAITVNIIESDGYIEFSDFTEGRYFICTSIGIPGDANNDKALNSLDSNLIKRRLTGINTNQLDSYFYDTNSDGIFNTIDSNLLKRIIAGN